MSRVHHKSVGPGKRGFGRRRKLVRSAKSAGLHLSELPPR